MKAAGNRGVHTAGTGGQAQHPRSPRPIGPHPLERDGRSVKIPVRIGEEWVWARVDADLLPRVLAYRWRMVGGYPTTTVYDTVREKAAHLQLHRLVTNAPAGVLVDHRYGNRLDARRCVLRFATHSLNAANRRAARRNRLSRYRGVTLHRQTGRWQAQAKHQDRFVYGGLHDSEESAALAYNTIAQRIWGAFAVLNRLRPA